MDRPTADQLAITLQRLLGRPTDLRMRDEAASVLRAYYGKSDEGKEAFRLKAERVGADPSWYWQVIDTTRDINGKDVAVSYRVTDIATHRPKNCMVITSMRGKRSFASVEWVAGHLGAPNTRTRTRAMEI